jgi:hypothetical protein
MYFLSFFNIKVLIAPPHESGAPSFSSYPVFGPPISAILILSVSPSLTIGLGWLKVRSRGVGKKVVCHVRRVVIGSYLAIDVY